MKTYKIQKLSLKGKVLKFPDAKSAKLFAEYMGAIDFFPEKQGEDFLLIKVIWK